MNGPTEFSLGLGFARVVLEIRREDGSIDQVVLDSVKISDSSLKIEDDEPALVDWASSRIFRSPEKTATLNLHGSVCPALDDGAYLKVTRMEAGA